MRLRFLFILFFFSGILMVQGSESYLGIVPEINISYKLKDIKFNVKAEFFQLFYANEGELGPEWDYQYENTDLQFFASKKVNPFISLALGYQYGIETGDKNTHRTIQQFSYVFRPGNLKWGHRVRAGQTFYEDEPTKFRFRYRLSVEIPLQGQSIDYNEFYVIASDEFLYAYQDKDQEYENRLAMYIGYLFENNSKFQLGIDYRTDLSSEPLVHNYWIRLGYLINL